MTLLAQSKAWGVGKQTTQTALLRTSYPRVTFRTLGSYPLPSPFQVFFTFSLALPCPAVGIANAAWFGLPAFTSFPLFLLPMRVVSKSPCAATVVVGEEDR